MDAQTPKAPAPKRQPWGENHGKGARKSRSWLRQTWLSSGSTDEFHVWLQKTVYTGIVAQSPVVASNDGWDASNDGWATSNDGWLQQAAWNQESYAEMGNIAEVPADEHVSQSSSSSQAVSAPPAEQGWVQMPINVVGATTKKKPRPWRGLSRHLEEATMNQSIQPNDDVAANSMPAIAEVINQEPAEEEAEQADESDEEGDFEEADPEYDLSVLDLIVEQGLAVLERADIQLMIRANPAMPQVSHSDDRDPITIDIPAPDV